MKKTPKKNIKKLVNATVKSTGFWLHSSSVLARVKLQFPQEWDNFTRQHCQQ